MAVDYWRTLALNWCRTKSDRLDKEPTWQWNEHLKIRLWFFSIDCAIERTHFNGNKHFAIEKGNLTHRQRTIRRKQSKARKYWDWVWQMNECIWHSLGSFTFYIFCCWNACEPNALQMLLRHFFTISKRCLKWNPFQRSLCISVHFDFCFHLTMG